MAVEVAVVVAAVAVELLMMTATVRLECREFIMSTLTLS